MIKIIVVIIAIALALILLAMRGRRKHPKLAQLCKWYYAHRGCHGNGVPENSMQAFRIAKESGYGIELDVHLLADGALAVMHDSSLQRTAGCDVCIENLTTEQLSQYRLEGTQEEVPLLSQVLELFDGDAPLLIELKSDINNYAELCEQACRLLEDYKGLYCMESFDPRCIIWLKKNRPDIVRGQLAENYFKTEEIKVPFVLKLILANHLMNFISLPDFIAYRYSDRKRFANWICRRIWGLASFTWTVSSESEFHTALDENWTPIFEGFRP